MVGGSGPGAVLSRAGRERAGQAVISAASFSLSGPPPTTAANVAAVRRAFGGWGVTTVVVPNDAALSRYEQGTNPAAALGLFTLAIGRSPIYQADAWVWRDVGNLGPSLQIDAAAFAGCTTSGRFLAPSHQAVSECVLAAARPSTPAP
jgi:hypothetical protein